MREFGLESLSSSQVSRAADAWRNRPLGEIRYLLLDARYEKVREGGVVRDAAVLSVIGIGPDQRRRVLGVSCACTGAPSWRPWLPVASPISFPMQASAPAQGRPRRRRLAALSVPSAIHHQPRHPKGHRQGAVAGRAGPSGGGLPRQRPQARRLAGDGDDRMRTSNPMERSIQHKRRTVKVRVFPNEAGRASKRFTRPLCCSWFRRGWCRRPDIGPAGAGRGRPPGCRRSIRGPAPMP